MQLKDKLKNISKEKNIDFNTLLRLYMYDRFLERLSKSKYRNNFILKGGFYLSTLFGVENRTTMDIDTAFRNANFDEETIIKMIKEIIKVEIDDNAKLSFVGIEPIRNEDEYGGFRVHLNVDYEEINEPIHIDIATGDPITPKEIRYKYLPLLGYYYIDLYAYNMETVLAEKIETILSRLELNGRMRDFYDIYLIYTKNWENINIDYLRKAIEKTFAKREYTGNLYKALDIVRNSELLKDRWDKYKRNFSYAEGIEYNDIMNCLEIMIEDSIPMEV
jgi:predicted nucleotidyltransferase component of viral defense system